MFDVAVRARTLTFSTNGMPDADAARAYIQDSLACWGVPVPDSLAPEKFAATLAENGEYRHEDEGVVITVKRSA